MRTTILLLAAAAMALLGALSAQSSQAQTVREWPVEWGGRVRDPFVAPDGKVWFVGQSGNYIANFDPSTSRFRRVEIEAGTYPHSLIVDPQGIVWYAGNRNGRIGRIDPSTGETRTFMTGEARDPHTLVLDGRGNIWFTSQSANRIGRLNMTTGHVDLITAAEQPSNPYGIVLDGEGRPVVSLFRAGVIARVDPHTLQLTRFTLGDPGVRSRRVEWTADGMMWYADEARGYLGRVNPSTGEVKEWRSPGGADAAPYALTKDDQGRLWYAEAGDVKRLIGFDPKTERFFASYPVSGTIRHMMFDKATGYMWFGTDANNLGRLATRGSSPS